MDAKVEMVEGPWELPEVWCWATLGGLGTWTGGGTPSKSNAAFWADGTVPWVSPKDMKTDVIGKTEDLITEEAVEKSSAKYVSAGSILMVMRSGILRHSFPVAIAERTVTLNQDLRALTPYGSIESSFVARYLNLATRRVLDDCSMDGTTVNSIEVSALERLPVPVAPLSEQRRIVERIDALFAEIAEGEAALDDARQGLETFRRALLKAAVTGELTRDWRENNKPAETGHDLLARIHVVQQGKGEKGGRRKWGAGHKAPDNPDLPEIPEGWAWARLSTLGNFGRGKSRHRPRDDKRLYGGTMPFLQTGIISNSTDYVLSYEQTYSELGVSQSRVWPEGTVCITIAANIAKTAITTFATCFPDSIVGLTPHKGIEPYWVHIWMTTVQQRLERYAPATAQKNINLEVLDSVLVPIPPPAETTEILRRVTEALSALSDTTTMLETEAADAARLRQSILKAAFEGKLVEQGPDDESAAALLTRPRAGNPSIARTRGRRATR